MKTNITQMVILAVFILSIVAGVIMFSMSGSNNSDTAGIEQIEIWGTLSVDDFDSVVSRVNSENQGTLSLVYKQLDELNFEQYLIEALADNVGPDAVLMSNTFLLKNQKKLTPIGNATMSEREFRDSFIEGSEILLTSEGTLGLPLLVDPLVMYWNRDILTSKNVARPPKTWEEVLSLIDRLTERRDDKSIIKSAIAFGDSYNVLFTKDIITALIFQSGGHIIGRNTNDEIISLLTDGGNGELSALTSSLTFFTQFADPLKPIYSWSRSLPDSRAAFLNGDLALYFAPASEARNIRAKNPNLNFDVATIPQPQNAPTNKTSGTIYSFSILESSDKKQSAFNNIYKLTNPKLAIQFSDLTGLPPASRELLSVLPNTAFGDIFWQSALWTEAWLDPNPKKTDVFFSEAVGNIITGKYRAVESANNLNKQINELIRQ